MCIRDRVIMEDRKSLTVDVDQLYRGLRKQVERGVNPQQRCFAEALQKIKPYYRKWYKGWQKLDLGPFY